MDQKQPLERGENDIDTTQEEIQFFNPWDEHFKADFERIQTEFEY